MWTLGKTAALAASVRIATSQQGRARLLQALSRAPLLGRWLLETEIAALCIEVLGERPREHRIGL